MPYNGRGTRFGLTIPDRLSFLREQLPASMMRSLIVVFFSSRLAHVTIGSVARTNVFEVSCFGSLLLILSSSREEPR